MDLHMKATIDDLKPSFSNLLQTNLFAKKLSYFFDNEFLETGKTMQELIEDGKIRYATSNTSEPVVLEVRQEEEGA